MVGERGGVRNTIGGKECLAAGRQQLPRCSSRQRRSRTTCRVGTAVASFKPLHRWLAKPAQRSSAVKTARLTVTTVSHSRCHAPLCESSRWKATARVVVTMASTSDGASSLSHDNASVCLLAKAVAVTKESSNMLWALSRDDLSRSVTSVTAPGNLLQQRQDILFRSGCAHCNGLARLALEWVFGSLLAA